MPSLHSFPFVASLALCAVTGCASMGFTSNPAALKHQVAFDHDCPEDKVAIVDSAEVGQGHASFKVDACGTTYRYERLGTAYFDSARGNPVDQAMGKTSPPPTQITSASTTSK